MGQIIRKIGVLAVVGALAAGHHAAAQDVVKNANPPPVDAQQRVDPAKFAMGPQLSPVQKLEIMNAAKDLEIARLRLAAVLQQAQVAGWELDLGSLTYKKAEPKKPEAGK